MCFAMLMLPVSMMCANPVAHDGDTFRCSGVLVHIAGIDAPELAGSPLCQPAHRVATAWCDHRGAARAKQALQRLLATGPVLVEQLGRAQGGPGIVARVVVNGRDASRYLLRHGFVRMIRAPLRTVPLVAA
ncbi:MAG: hypothetical protein RIS94_1995 [Pseudomonadota bacterium]|jgi:endonuclease YncB( thermonuclease family)